MIGTWIFTYHFSGRVFQKLGDTVGRDCSADTNIHSPKGGKKTFDIVVRRHDFGGL